MHNQLRLLRLAAAAAATVLLLAQAPPPASTEQGQQTSDPPVRVGRLASQSGTVSFHGPGETQWSRAPLNYPVVQGDAFWTDANAQAVIELSASRVAMAPGTELGVAALTDAGFEASEPQGELYLGLRAAGAQENYAVQTPRGLVTLTVPGRYGVIAGTTQDPTVVTVVEGSAHVEGPGVSLEVAPGQAATITGADPFEGEVGPARHDAFLAAMLNSERPSPAGTPAAVAALPGAEDLSRYGSWSESPAYGDVWYPEVPPDWAPYREGSWSYVAPWGWTWVDSAPWGFAPFHYGRWAEIGGRWAWVPGNQPAPVYAPALVTFFGAGAIAGAGIGAALAEGHIGWLPLGPHEPFRPWYPASGHYLQRVNPGRPGGPGMPPPPMIGQFANLHAATVVPGSVMAASRPVGPAHQRLDPAQFAQARPLVGQPPLRPTAATMGITPAGAPGQPHLPPLRAPAQPAGIAAMPPLAAPLPLRPPPAPGQIGQPSVVTPHLPPLAGPGGGAGRPPPPPAYRAPGAVFQQPAPPAAFHPTPPPPAVMHPPPPAAFHPPPPVMHPSPPVIMRAPPPTPVHAAPPPPQFHPAPPQPVAHTPPPEQNARHKRPGEP